MAAKDQNRPVHKTGKVFLIGPGGVGKTTVGPILAAKLDAAFVDLDTCFCERVGPIRKYLDELGYAAYIRTNASLFRCLLEESQREPSVVFALSSGFLVTDVEAEIVRENQRVLREQGVAVLMLPSSDLDQSVRIIVERQLRRGLSLERESQMRLIQQRVHPYAQLGDIQVFSSEAPPTIASEIARRLESLRTRTKLQGT